MMFQITHESDIQHNYWQLRGLCITALREVWSQPCCTTCFVKPSLTTSNCYIFGIFCRNLRTKFIPSVLLHLQQIHYLISITVHSIYITTILSCYRTVCYLLLCPHQQKYFLSIFQVKSDILLLKERNFPTHVSHYSVLLSNCTLTFIHT